MIGSDPHLVVEDLDDATDAEAGQDLGYALREVEEGGVQARVLGLPPLVVVDRRGQRQDRPWHLGVGHGQAWAYGGGGGVSHREVEIVVWASWAYGNGDNGVSHREAEIEREERDRCGAQIQGEGSHATA